MKLVMFSIERGNYTAYLGTCNTYIIYKVARLKELARERRTGNPSARGSQSYFTMFNIKAEHWQISAWGAHSTFHDLPSFYRVAMNSDKVHVLIQISLFIILIRLSLLLSSLSCSVPDVLLFSAREYVSVKEAGSSGRVFMGELFW